MNKSSTPLKRITLNIPEKLYNEVRELALNNGFNFTTQVSVLLRNAIDQKMAIDVMPSISQYLLNKQKGIKKEKNK